MRSILFRVWVVGWAAAASIAACGTGVNVGSSASGAGGGNQGSASSGGGTSATGMGGAASSVTSSVTTSSAGGPDASTDAGDATITPMPFDCQGCLCDGATHYCLVIHGGAPAGNGPKGPPPEPTCDDDASPNDCKPLPAMCAGKPSCACLDMGGACQCDEMGGGVTVTCVLP